ncbi:hypothetical protein [Roseovarius dicentrarchi]|uniref:hypothetical protein n=1 Tax=Roseovarius dicentrarchi TaxID=2250573 RepID=UPI0013966EE8|nr:hypothetical protein [Roseovarius dicentrarchi]
MRIPAAENMRFPLQHDAHGFVVAKEDHLTGVFDRMVAAPSQLGDERLASNLFVDMGQLAPQDAAALCRLRSEPAKAFREKPVAQSFAKRFGRPLFEG